MELTVKHFSQLTKEELYEIYRLRVAVFVVEQNCPYQEIDGKDVDAYHLWLTDKGDMVAYLRVLAPGVSFKEAAIGRVLATHRRQGLATRLMKEAIELAREKFSAAAIRIEAQTYARQLYENLGFKQCSGEFLEDGIPHIEMLWKENTE